MSQSARPTDKSRLVLVDGEPTWQRLVQDKEGNQTRYVGYPASNIETHMGEMIWEELDD